MTTIKSHTDLQQAKKLAEILPIESADMHYSTWTILDGEFIVSPNQGSTIENLQEDYGNQIIPCWSLAALLGVLPNPNLFEADGLWHIFCDNNLSCINGFDNPVDACVAMIEKMNELNML